MRLAGTKLAANHQYRGFGDQLYDLSGQRPSLDLNFSSTKSLVDATTGQNLVTFTRASSGTYVDSQGVIRTATTNLLLRSEEFATTWTNTNSTDSTNVTVAPNGTLTADLLLADATTTASARDIRQNASGTVASTHTFSVYAKAKDGNFLGMMFRNQAAVANFCSAEFNLSNGTVSIAGTNGGNATGALASITDVGNGWYRCSLSGIADTSGTQFTVILIGRTSSNNNSVIANTELVYLWGAQLEQSSTVGEYIPTTSTINSAPRFDHSPTTGESLGLLVEEQRTNLLLQSEAFDTASWNKVVGGTGSTPVVNTNTATSPDGTTTADQLVLALNGGTTTSDSSYITQSYSSTSGTTYTVSAWMRTITGNVTISFDLDSSNTNTVTVTPVWQRFTFTRTSSTTGSRTVRIGLRGTFGVSDSATFYIWGAQLEAGTFPTSYIPTTTATVTRSADVASITGSNFSSWYRQDEGTVFGDFTRTASTNTQQGRVFSFSDGTNTNLLEIYQTGGSNPAAQIIVTTSQAGWTTSNFTVGTSTREVLGYQLNNTNASFNGSSETADTVCTMPTALTQARIGDRQDGVRTLNGTIRRLTYWPTRLPNETLQGITQ